MKRYLKAILIAFVIGAAAVPATEASTSPAIGVAAASISSGAGHLDITVTDETPRRFYIYAITGQLVKTVDVESGTVSVELPQGYYVVKCSDWSKKVVVKG